MKAAFIVMFFFSVQATIAQSLAVQRMTTSNGGGTSLVSLSGKQYRIQQSIGQQSVIGTFDAAGKTVFQGFLHPVRNASVQTTESIGVLVYPNPFQYQLVVSLHTEVSGPVSVAIVDVLGREVYQRMFSSASQFQCEPGDLPAGSYIVRVTAGHKQYLTKLIRE